MRDLVDFKQLLEAGHFSEAELEAVEQEVIQEVDEAANAAKEAPFPDPEEVSTHVFSD